ncbi:MAG: hypothetical protein ACE5LU_29055 [Anaerolineae bacterium]
MSGQTLLLLDKNVVRRYFEGVSALARGLVLAEEEQQAVVLVHLARRKGQQLFLPIEAFNLLQAHRHQIAPAETVMFLKRSAGPIRSRQTSRCPVARRRVAGEGAADP